MKPAWFDYYAPRELDEALRILGDAGEEGRVLAGGQSLIPMLNLREQYRLPSQQSPGLSTEARRQRPVYADMSMLSCQYRLRRLVCRIARRGAGRLADGRLGFCETMVSNACSNGARLNPDRAYLFALVA